MKPLAIGCHVFAGGFTMGVRKHFRVPAQLERHNFGTESVAANLPETEFVNRDNWEDWPSYEGAKFLYGNPRCTGFSLVTSGHDESIHGPFAKCTEDIHELCKHGVKEDFDLVIWESVQQAFTTGRPLLDYLRDNYFAGKGYRIAHVFLNAASFRNAQIRKRYFFVAYRDDRNFNVEPPVLPARQVTVGDILGPLMGRSAHESKRDGTYDFDTFTQLGKDERKIAPLLDEGSCLNSFASRRGDELKEISPEKWEKWDDRTSEMPFSMHCIRKLRWDWCSPTLFSACARLIHPKKNRPITVGEAATLMGWDAGSYPRGDGPYAQIVKGVCPEVGEWLAKQALLYLDGSWGKEDWDTKYDHHEKRWVGHDYTSWDVKPQEKVLHLSNYTPPFPQWDERKERRKEERYANGLS
jgi:site-specific DNA-cytosine methylase